MPVRYPVCSPTVGGDVAPLSARCTRRRLPIALCSVTTATRELDDILDGDLTVALAHVTPRQGVVVSAVNNFGWDSETGTLTFTSNLAAFKKLRRLADNPSVAVVFHAREHGTAEGDDFVIAQGDATFSWHPDRSELEPLFERPGLALGPGTLGGPFWNWWDGPFWWDRVVVRVRVQRILAFADRECTDMPTVIGRPEPTELTPSQVPPEKGVVPRIDVAKATRTLSGLPHRLLGWVGADGYPVVAPVGKVEDSPAGIRVALPNGLLPAGARRAGLTGHAFTEGNLGASQIVMTGWVESDGDTALYAPHTRQSYSIPASKLAWRAGVGTVDRIGLVRARRAGVPSLPPLDIRHRVSTPVQRRVANPIGRRVARLMSSQAVLETTGRKSGLPRQTPVGGRLVGSTYWMVSEFGRKSQYVQNLIADSNVRLQLRGVWRTGTAVIVDGDDPRERLRELPRLNSAVVGIIGSNLLTVRIDLD
ncbi:nitroreductase family deazaflavin-dependent oxidoreductase [Antrihabitans cavernicola]|uniref:Nitroreductase family deazaflavin-dependent oxidoreductase n=1 Tax=Antrihabitans cavernicola TaxID=2495913 RepID=A0A5A7S804_9NOCA|nr:nitroreductase family deazaflavin-dependent oxidoreductase [Spelaeibacter cavernicola]